MLGAWIRRIVAATALTFWAGLIASLLGWNWPLVSGLTFCIVLLITSLIGDSAPTYPHL